MKINGNLLLGYLTGAIFCIISSINLKYLPEVSGNKYGICAVKISQLFIQNYGNSRGDWGASAADKVHLFNKSDVIKVNNSSTTDFFIDTEAHKNQADNSSLNQVAYYLAFMSVLVCLMMRTNKASMLLNAIVKFNLDGKNINTNSAKNVNSEAKNNEPNIGHTIANMTQDLQKSAEYALDIFEDISVSIVATTPTGNILSLNYATCQLLGYSKKELIGKPIATIFKKTQLPLAGRETENLTAGDSVRNVEKIYLSKHEKKIIVLLSISIIRDGKGEVTGKLYVAQDITENKRVERDLRRSEKKFRQLVETVNAAAFIYQGRQLRYVNSQTEAITGYSREELLSMDLYDLIHPEFRSVVKKWGKVSEHRKKGNLKHEILLISKSGEERWIEATVDLIKFERKGSILVTAFDISDRKLSDLELERSLSLLQATIESTADGILAVDSQGNIVTFNSKFAQMWQVPDFLLDSRSNNQVLGFGINQLKYPETFLKRSQELSDVPELESYDIIEFKDGRIFERYSLPQRTGGKISGRVFSFRDVTERLRAEEALRKSEERFNLLTRATNDAVWDLDLVNEELWWSEEFNKLFGHKVYNNQSIKLGFWSDKIHPEEREKVIENFNKTLAGDAQYWLEEYSFRCADGRYVFVLDRGYIIRNESGKAVRAIGTMMDITERKQAEEIIRYQAVYDQLTGLPNRILFNQRLSASLKQLKNSKKILAVMFLDLDRFKKINDTLGHAAGDRLLEIFAARINDTLQGNDTVARWGGDEFTVLLPDINSPEDAVKTAQRIQESLKPVFKLEEQSLHITSSIGIALYPDDGEDAETLVKNADAALYRAKERGRNNYQFYNSTINPQGSQLLILESKLHEAPAQGEFEVYYQPRVNITTWKIQGMEALLRWHHPELGLIYPNTFIPIAEENGLIVSIGEWVLETACKQNKAWQDALQPDLRIAVNFSARQFQQFNLLKMVSDCLEKTGLEPKYLELEITESTAMQDMEYTKKVLTQLQNMGVQIALDDFGTGYSSLTYLKKFPLNILKIDKSFVSGLTNDLSERAIANAVATLGRDLNLNVVAEGVETKQQLECLRSLHCQEIQGYYFSPPLSANDATKILIDSLLKKAKIA
ncbi:bifunctional diguanylate cyclase/phosphodiesterase [Microcoleus anatoxicus]|uniref:bifunctional diguanylate cyclase/phosphodiesterase n=1 Tax=Microcoleus anatoxicus TaxID=2705319 RepID=UPI002972B8FE|nr:MAG: bifunctional diguanylate cyclase/phosphodiesterase [Oscillatoriales cyanobacterium]